MSASLRTRNGMAYKNQDLPLVVLGGKKIACFEHGDILPYVLRKLID